ncbi:lysozyme g-like [Gadus chalcogrammus]|uniref:lysozyme g-like n=1 Tax=Gadus chalcogrammus TaxID=1042646 RepID=UPI0024C25C10|nr:lysozyme g-like [Gadus chalcogrammus]
MDYGDILKVETTGASKETAEAYYDRNLSKGVTASEIMAKEDLDSMKKYKTIIKNVAERWDVNPALIAGIISRESEAGFSIKNTDPPGWGDKGNAFGLMQVDKRHHDIPKHQTWDGGEHLYQATGILVYFIGRIQKKFPSWTAEQQLKGALAAYNKGDGVVRSYKNVDENTTGKDYSNDVVARAKWYWDNLFKPSCWPWQR